MASKATQRREWEALGGDTGNGFFKLARVTSEGVKTYSTITAFARVDTRSMESLSVDTTAIGGGIIRYGKEPVNYAFGNLAIEQGGVVWTRKGSEGRYASAQIIKGLCFSAAQLFPNKKRLGLYIVLGLPAKLFLEKPYLRQQIKDALDGQHFFTLDGGNTWYDYAIEVATVVMEGAGVFFNPIYAPLIKDTTESAAIDIGNQTCDLYAQRARRAMSHLCAGENLGADSVCQIFRDAFKAQTGTNPSELQVQSVLTAYISRHMPKVLTEKRKALPYPDIHVFGKRIEEKFFEETIGNGVRIIGDDIVTFILEKWATAGNGASFKPLVGIGGGQLLFADRLYKAFPQLEFTTNSIFDNAIGYSSLAASMLKK